MLGSLGGLMGKGEDKAGQMGLAPGTDPVSRRMFAIVGVDPNQVKKDKEGQAKAKATEGITSLLSGLGL